MRIAAALVLGLSISSFANAEGTWRFEAGIAYVSGIDDVADHYEENLRRARFAQGSFARLLRSIATPMRWIAHASTNAAPGK